MAPLIYFHWYEHRGKLIFVKKRYIAGKKGILGYFNCRHHQSMTTPAFDYITKLLETFNKKNKNNDNKNKHDQTEHSDLTFYKITQTNPFTLLLKKVSECQLRKIIFSRKNNLYDP